MLKIRAKTQSLVALSSGESQFYVACKVSLARDLGIELQGEVWGDASAALGIIK